MHRRALFVFALAGALCGHAAAQEFRPETIIAIERAALDRWAKGEPQGYLEIDAPEITYFDPTTATRVDGIEATRALLTPLTGKIKLSRYEILNPVVYRRGDLAVLSFNLVTYGERSGDALPSTRWNTTEVYALLDGKWRIVHSHFSLTQPQAPPPK